MHVLSSIAVANNWLLEIGGYWRLPSTLGRDVLSQLYHLAASNSAEWAIRDNHSPCSPTPRGEIYVSDEECQKVENTVKRDLKMCPY